MSNLSETIRKLDCSGNLSLKVAMFEIADAVDDIEKDHANTIAATVKLMDETLDLKAERDALAAELAAFRGGSPTEPFGYFRNDGLYWHEWHDDYENAIALYEHPLLTDAELKLIMDARAFREKMMSVDTTMTRAEAVFTAPKEDFDWPEDRGFHPQKGLAK